MNGGRRYKYGETLGGRFWFNIAVIVITLCVALWFTNAEANSAAAGTSSDVIGRSLTVKEIEERAAIKWAVGMADHWMEEDREACEKNGSIHPATYTRCMVVRSNTRILYMLRRSCVGVSAITDICNQEVE